MKIVLKHSIKLMMLIGTLVAFTSCQEEEANFKIYEYPEQSVTGFSPSVARPTQEITINGTNFGTLKNAVTVFFNGVATTQSEIISVTDNQIIAKVPLKATSGKITVKVWTVTKEIPGDFSFIPGGEISNISPAFGLTGSLVTILGKNFGTDTADIDVKFSGVSAEIVSLADDKIVVKVPDANSGIISVYVGLQKIDGISFAVNEQKLTGTIIGTAGSWGNNSATTIAAALDGNIATFHDGLVTVGYLGYDLGATVKANITRVRYYPRSTHASRMAGGKFIGTNDATAVGTANGDVLHTIVGTPPVAWTEVIISSTTSYRYVYYYSGNNTNVAEIEFYGRKD